MLLQIVKEKPALWSFILSPEAEDEEEHFLDPPEEGEEAKQESDECKTEDDGGRSYRGLHRNPLYCRAESSCLWELERVCDWIGLSSTSAMLSIVAIIADLMQDVTHSPSPPPPCSWPTTSILQCK